MMLVDLKLTAAPKKEKEKEFKATRERIKE